MAEAKLLWMWRGEEEQAWMFVSLATSGCLLRAVFSGEGGRGATRYRKLGFLVREAGPQAHQQIRFRTLCRMSKGGAFDCSGVQNAPADSEADGTVIKTQHATRLHSPGVPRAEEALKGRRIQRCSADNQSGGAVRHSRVTALARRFSPK